MDKEIEIYKVPDNILVIRQWYSEEELNNIFNEIDILFSDNSLEKNKDGSEKTHKKGYGIFLNEYYKEKNNSSILKYNSKLQNEGFIQFLTTKIDPFYRHIETADATTTLLNYYENNHGYEPHIDNSVFTTNVILWREPKKFSGGEFIFSERNINLNLNFNDMVIFPGYLLHHVTEVKMDENYIPWISGRHAITNFIRYR